MHSNTTLKTALLLAYCLWFSCYGAQSGFECPGPQCMAFRRGRHKHPKGLQKPAHFSAQPPLCLGVILCCQTSLLGTARWLWDFSGQHCHRGPCCALLWHSMAWHGMVQHHQGSLNTVMLLPSAVRAVRQALAGSSGLQC